MRGLTQREAAQAAGVDANTIWRYEAGRSRPSGLALRGLADIYDTGGHKQQSYCGEYRSVGL